MPKLTLDERDAEMLDFRQKLFWDYYLVPTSETFLKKTESALKAGYAESTASQISQRPFFRKRMKRIGMLAKAEKLLDKTLTLKYKDETGKVQSDILRIQTDVAKHITKTLGKDEGYSERSEVTGKDGAEIKVSSITFNPPIPTKQPDEQDKRD